MMTVRKQFNGSKLGIYPSALIRYNLSRRTVTLILVTPVLITVILTILSTPIFLEIHPRLWGENKLVETIQFPIFALAGIQSLIVAWHTKKQMERTYVWGFYGIFSIGMIFIALEEIAWGQQYLGFKSPDFMRNLNVQNEFTFHNVTFLQERSDFLNLGFGLAGIVGLMLTSQKKYIQIGVPRILFPWLILITLLSMTGVWVDLFVDTRPINYSIHVQTETAELLIAITGVLYTTLNYRSVVHNPPGSMRLKRGKIIGDRLQLNSMDGREITVPTPRFPPFTEASSEDISDMILIKGGTVIQWNKINERIPIRNLLKATSEDEKNRSGPIPLKPIYSWLTLVVGIISLVWFLLIPGDIDNAVFLGFSAVRLLLFSAGIIPLIFITISMIMSKNDESWVQMKSSRLNSIVMKPLILKIGIVTASIGIPGICILLLISFTNTDPFIAGILSRLAPWLFWFLVFLVEVVAIGTPLLLRLEREKLSRALNLSLQENWIVITLNGNREVKVPTSHYAELEKIAESQLEGIQFIGEGLRIQLPELDFDICVESFLANEPFNMR